jgi:hypothetical protein
MVLKGEWMKTEKAGEYLALISIIVAVLAGLAAPVIAAATQGYIATLLVVLGIIVGLTTISEKEVTAFLITSIVFVVVGTVGGAFTAINNVAAPVGSILNAIVGNIATFVAPAAIIVGFKAVYALASRK